MMLRWRLSQWVQLWPRDDLQAVKTFAKKGSAQTREACRVGCPVHVFSVCESVLCGVRVLCACLSVLSLRVVGMWMNCSNRACHVLCIFAMSSCSGDDLSVSVCD